MKKLSLLGVVALFLVSVSLAAAQASPVNVSLAAVNNSGVTASATVAQSGNGIKVDITFKGFAPNSAHAGHIHQGSCQQQGPVKFPLPSVTADANGNGTVSATLTNVTFAEVTNGQYYLNYHVADNPPGDGITCGNIRLAAGGGAPTGAPAAGEGGASMTDNSLNLWLLAGLAAVLSGSVIAYGSLRRKSR
jgi:hypothetical protein